MSDVHPTAPRLALTVQQAAEATTLSRATLYRAIAWGDLRPSRIGRRVVIAVSELQRFLEAMQRER